MKTTDGITIDLTPGYCACVCDGRTSGPKRMFLQGHDARLKGELIQAGREDLPITVIQENGKPKLVDLDEALSLFSVAMQDKVRSGVAREARVSSSRAAKTLVVAKVGRWPYEGTIDSKGRFVYTDGKGNQRKTNTFTVVK